MYINRDAHSIFSELLAGFPIVTITGPRQSGKTTMARHFLPDKPYVSLEDLDQLDYATNDPRGFLRSFSNGAIIDEAQNCPSLFSYLQSHVDASNQCGQFVLTGSQQFGMLSKITQSLAGRAGLLHLLPFSYSEIQASSLCPDSLEGLLLKGLYPPVYFRKIRPELWYANYIQTYIERDVKQLINIENLSLFQRFIKLCAARSGQLLNYASLGNDCGINQSTVKKWLSVLEASYIIYLLRPHHTNFNKRIVKTPKLYFYDTGLCAWLLDIHNIEQIKYHAQRGALFETWVISELSKQRYNKGEVNNLFFWRDKTGNEVDVIVDNGHSLTPIEIKSGETISTDFFKGIRHWSKLAGDLSNNPTLIYGGDLNQKRSDINIISWENLTYIN